MIKKFKLKHFDMLLQSDIDYAYFMQELDGYVNKRWLRKRKFKKSFFRTHALIEQIKKIELKNVLINPDFKMKAPDNIDSITFSAMMSIHNYISKPSESLSESIATVVTMVCYSEKYRGDFEVGGYRFDSFKKQIMNSPALDVMGLYNRINKQLDDSNTFWEKLFLEVNTTDEDYDNAEGYRMKSFNVINTIKNICNDFNYTEKQAWQVPYALTQTNSLSKATQSYVQDRMRSIKEDRMKSQRKNHL